MVNAIQSRVVVIDDDESILSLFEGIFASEARVKLITTTSPDKALAQVVENEVDIFISDGRMPNMDGLELLTRVREVSPQTTRILLTAHPELAQAMSGINDGLLDRFAVKPWEPRDVLTTVRQLLAVKAQTDDLQTKHQQLRVRFRDRIRAIEGLRNKETQMMDLQEEFDAVLSDISADLALISTAKTDAEVSLEVLHSRLQQRSAGLGAAVRKLRRILSA